MRPSATPDPGHGAVRGGPVAVAVTVVVLAVYLATAPRTVVLEDDGAFLISAWFAGLAHPPGYPLYTMLSALAAKVPFGTVAFRVHALTALFGALACGVLALLLARLLRDRMAAAAAALAFAFTPTFWSQAVVAEVYALNVLLWLLAALLAWEVGRDPDGRPDRVRALGLVAGLGLANHWPLFVLGAAPLVLLVPLRAWPRVAWRALPFVLLGLLPYAWLFARAYAPVEVSPYGPVRSLADLWYYVSRAPYGAIDADPAATWHDKGAFLVAVGHDLLRQFGFAGVALLAVGLAAAWRRLGARTATVLLLVFLAGTAGLLALLDFAYTPLMWAVFRVYPLVPYAVAALFLGVGLCQARAWLGGRSEWRHVAAGAALLLLPAALAVQHGGAIQRPNAAWSQAFADHVLDGLPPDAVLVLAGDAAVGVLGYHLLVEGRRPDVTPVSQHGLLLPGRLFQPRRHSRAEQQALLERYVDATARPVYHISPLVHGHGETSLGLLKRIDRGLDAGIRMVEMGPRESAYLDHLLAAGPFPDGFAELQNATHVAMFAETLGWVLLADPGQAEDARMRALVGRVATVPLAAVALAETLLDAGDPAVLAALADALAAQALSRLGQRFSEPSLVARAHAVRARAARLEGRAAEARSHVTAGLAAWAHPANPLRQRAGER